MKKIIVILTVLLTAAGCGKPAEEAMRGIVLSVDDLESVDWAALAHDSGINTIGTHITPQQVLAFTGSEKGQRFLADCRRYGIAVEHQLHAMSELLPRSLFDVDSTMFRMDSTGRRIADYNCCAHSPAALDTIAANARRYAALLPSDNHRYYFWVDDNKPMCCCPLCRDLSQSEQALIVENSMIRAIREVDPQARLAHLAYIGTMSAPRKVAPADGIFLEFAPFYRVWDRPLREENAFSPRPYGRGITHGDYLRHLRENIEVFGTEDAVILEYWLDASLFSNWKKPAVRIPWHREVFEADLETYASMGLHNVTTFGVYMDSTYFANYPDRGFLREYGTTR
ncbi:MAG: DUF4838 domain-containing protein [Bacteroidales bacterium]|nr:DUF4838 domain-containing protein [Bacteroidales bacterium]